MAEKQFKKGDVIFREGDQGESMFCIAEGSVSIIANYGGEEEQKLTDLKKGQIFGEMAVIEAYPRSATAIASEDVKLDEISTGQVSGYFKSQPDKIIDIMKHLGTRIGELSGDYSEACALVEQFKEDEKAAGLTDKFKKFAKAYKLGKSAENIANYESKKKAEASAHSDGFTKDVAGYSKGSIIFREGEAGDCMYDIHSGKIGIYKAYGTPNERCLAELEPNRFFGEIGMLENAKRSATAVALDDDTTLEKITSKDLKELFEKNPPKVEMILAHMSYRLRKLSNEYMKVCKLVSEALEGKISAELRSFKPSFYD